MEKKKQISLKIDPDTLEKIDEMAKALKWHKRNAIINQVLASVFDACTVDDIRKMVRYWKLDSTSRPRITVSDGRS